MALGDGIRENLDELGDLPALSPVVAHLSATLGRDDVEVGEVEAIIRQDPVVAAKVISAANAAVYAAHMPTTSIRGALLRLGLMRVRRLALLVSLYSAVPVKPAMQATFWAHSLATAYAAEAIARHAVAFQPDPEATFLAGLLHDMGLLVLASHYPRELAAVRTFAERRDTQLWEAEIALLGIEHGEVGGRLAAYWSFPKAITVVIQHHHRVDMAPRQHQAVAAIVRLAEASCSGEEGVDLGEGGQVDLSDPALAPLGLDEASLRAVMDDTRGDSRHAGGVLETTR